MNGKHELAEIDLGLKPKYNSGALTWTEMPNTDHIVLAILAGPKQTFNLLDRFDITVGNKEITVTVVGMTLVNKFKKKLFGKISGRTIIRCHLFLEEQEQKRIEGDVAPKEEETEKQ